MRREILHDVIAAAAVIVLLPALCLFTAGCGHDQGTREHGTRLQVVTTLFPLFEFARAVGGDRADVSLLLPPGIEPHSYEPTPRDITRIRNAALFVYTSPTMEPWAAGLLAGGEKDRITVAAGAAIEQRTGTRNAHLWLDFGFSEEMLDAVLDGFIRAEPSSADVFRKNADLYRQELRSLDRDYRTALSQCRTTTVVSGGHATFGHLARRYGLDLKSAYGLSPSSDPSPQELARISRIVREHSLRYIFYEELLEPRIAETLARETGAGLLLLHGGHNISKADRDHGVTFISLMRKNLDNLKQGLECRP